MLALPGIELNVEVSIAGGKPRSIPAEGVQSGDGSVDPWYRLTIFIESVT